MNSLANKFPEDERFNLSSQIRRAADSIALNISGQAEFKRFIGYSRRSQAEGVTCLHKARNRKYCSQEEFALYYDESFELMNMMMPSAKH